MDSTDIKEMVRNRYGSIAAAAKLAAPPPPHPAAAPRTRRRRAWATRRTS